MSSKKELRTMMLRRRSALTKQEIEEKSKCIVEKVQTLINGKVGLYYPIKNEVDVRSIDAEIAYPKVIQEMAFYEYDGNFVRGKYNIPEPTGLLTEVDTLIVPGSVFDLDGYRIGYGGGYYDKYMKAHHVKIGVCFDFQVIEKVPREVHDVRLDWLVTEKRIIKYKE
jgi:5-formyltetrahydrofolate cyclo-ligase